MKKAMKVVVVMLVAVMVLASVVSLAACKGEDLVIWVGEESATYYQSVMDKYVAYYAEKNGSEFPYKVVVKGIDSSTAAEAVAKDPQAGPAIFTVPHDNLGKLIGDHPIIAAMTSESLLKQIAEDNPEGYQKVVKNTIGGNEYVFAAPYIGQALVLYYNKAHLTEEDVKTWEGIQAKAAALGKDVKATTVMGNDSYNFSFLMLARKKADNSTSVKIYEGNTIEERLNTGCFCTGDDTMASFKWGQRFFANPNGGQLSGSTTFDVLLKDQKVLSLVGGAWKYDSVSAALGSNLGIAQLPEYTITAADAYGTCAAGTVFKSGTFADCKVLCINAMSNITKSNKLLLEEVVQHLASKGVQEGSFEECNNLPAYKNAASEFEAMKADNNEALLAAKQTEMATWGIPQPFGYHNFLNLYFYQKGADTYTQDIILKKDSANGNAAAYDTDEKLKAGLQIIQNIWQTGTINPLGK